MRLLLFYSFLVCVTLTMAQTYLHPTTGLNSTFSGGCPEHTCSGFYYDDGGATGNYSPGIGITNIWGNQLGIYQTFCPDQDDVCLRATFSEFNSRTQAWWQNNTVRAQMQVLNGPAQNSAQIGYLYGNYAASVPLVYTSSHSSGCLTFRFFSGTNSQNGSFPGWTSTFSCVPCLERQPNGLSDCLSGAQQICNNDPLSGFTPGPGSAGEGCAGCAEAEGETFSAWYYFEIAADGNLAFDLIPNNPGEDLDFALYGPNVDCGSLGDPIRCTYAMNTGTGGMVAGAGCNSQGVNGCPGNNGWVNDLNVTAGQQYVLLVNNWSEGGGGYTINWTGSASLECAPINLPVDWLDFSGTSKPGYNQLEWATATERENDYFLIEKSVDGYLWFPVGTVKATGNSTTTQNYSLKDNDVEPGIIQYYRLKQFDFDGTMDKHQDIIAIVNNDPKPYVVSTINSIGQQVREDAKGIVIDIYSDGTRIKRFNP